MEKIYNKQTPTPSNTTIDKKPLTQQAMDPQPSLNDGANETPKPFYKDAPRHKKTFRERPGTKSEQQKMLIDDLCDIDKKVAFLLTKRVKALRRLQESNPISYEKTIRKSWEETVQTFSKDPKFSHQLFTLIQHLEVFHDPLAQQAFSLKPKQQPVNVALNLPSCIRAPQLLLTLAVCSGATGELRNALINEPTITCVKALKQLGADLFWETSGAIFCKKPLPDKTQYKQLIDKVLHVGDNSLLFYLLTFLSILRPARIKFIGDSALKLTNFSFLRRFLPQLGARIASAIHGQEGLPMRLEASAILPEEITLPSELPIDAVIALFMVLPGWGKKVLVHMNSHPQTERVLDEVLPILSACDIAVQTLTPDNAAISVQITPGEASIQNLSTDAYLPAASTLLALPAFAGGSVVLKKSELQTTRNLSPAITLLKLAGLEITETADCLSSEKTQEAAPGSLDISNVPEELFPLAFTLSLIPMVKKQMYKMPKLPPNVNKDILDSYLERLGFASFEERLVIREKNQSPWISPSANWSFAFSLAAFLFPGLKLGNPESIEAFFPQYWKIYNALPFTPNDAHVQPERRAPEETAEPQTQQTPTRRRIITEARAKLIEPFISKDLPLAT